MAIVNKRELAHRLGISAPTLDQLLLRNPEFPVLTRGGNGKQWQFDAEAAEAFMASKRQAAEEAREARAAHLRALASVTTARILPTSRRSAEEF